jgi:hypothetical protein
MNNSKELQNKLYSRVIYKSPDDTNIQSLLKKGQSSKSPRKFKKWSPDISYEERIIRKKQREEDYIKKIYPDERPILLVKKKHVYKNMEGANLAESIPDQETGLKISRNTELLVDVEEDINENEKYVRRFTMVHDGKHQQDSHNEQQQPDDEGAIFKVEGIEYLPEGFLELDPLLMKDEFYFESPEMEKMFLDEQKRIKALRRKQYAEKNYSKKRDVTILIIDEYKDKIVEFLQLWYNKYKRKLNPAELKEVAKRLNTSFDVLNKLQELFHKKRKLMKAKKGNVRFANSRPSPNNMHVTDSYDNRIGFSGTGQSMNDHLGSLYGHPNSVGKSLPEWRSKYNGFNSSSRDISR